MAVMQLEDGTIYSDIGAIANKLAALNVQIDYWAIDQTPALQEILVQDLLNVTEKRQILAAFNSEFELLKLTGGCQWHDLKVLHPGSPQIKPKILGISRF